MATHSTVSHYDAKREEWSSYIERMKHYFIANDVDTAEKKKPILLSACGPATYRLIRRLVTEAALPTKTFDELVKVVKDYCEPKLANLERLLPSMLQL